MRSISNRQLTLLRKLQSKKHREKEQRFLVEGERAIEQIIENGLIEIEYLVFDENKMLWESTSWSDKAKQLQFVSVQSDTFLEITDTENPQGVLALCSIPSEAEPEQLMHTEGILVATDRIQDPGNLGTIVRTATWFGVKGILLGKGTVDLFNPKVVRSTAGTTGAIPFTNIELKQILELFEEAGWTILLLDASNEATDLREIKIASKTVVVIGNEANGINPDLAKNHARKKVKITSPSLDVPVESLNASIALAITLYALTS